MSAAKHTPGPWASTDQGIRSREQHVANVMPIPQSQANARLIAAAPDLLAALQGLVAEFGRGVDDDSDISTHQPIIAARRAIRAAKGEA